MQVSATLIAAQQAAREAQRPACRCRSRPSPPAPFAATLEKTEGFSPLPLKQTAAAAPATASQPAQASAPARMGQHIDITV